MYFQLPLTLQIPPMRLFSGIIVLTVFIACKSSPEPVNIQTIPQANKGPLDLNEYPYAVPLKDPDNKIFTSTEIFPKADKPTVVLFWLTTCKPCTRELTAIQQNFDTWQREVPFHLVALSEDHVDAYQAFVSRVKKEQWPFDAYMDMERRFQDLLPGNLNGLPQTFIFDKHGNLTWKKRGFLPGDEAQYLGKIKEAAGS